jgi:hypothetical protein
MNQDQLIEKQKLMQSKFDVALAEQFLSDSQSKNDIAIVFSTLLKWHDAAKSDKQKKVLESMINANNRIKSYTDQKMTVAKRAVAEMLIQKHENILLEHENKKLVERNKDLEYEIKNILNQNTVN